MLPSFKVISLSVPEKKIFLRFLQYMGMVAILVRWPGPFEQTFVPHSIEAPYEIWFWLAQWFLRKRCLKSVDDGGLTYLRGDKILN